MSELRRGLGFAAVRPTISYVGATRGPGGLGRRDDLAGIEGGSDRVVDNGLDEKVGEEVGEEVETDGVDGGESGIEPSSPETRWSDSVRTSRRVGTVTSGGGEDVSGELVSVLEL